MTRHALLALALALPLTAFTFDRPVHAADNACWLSAMSQSEKRDLVLTYARIKQVQGKAAADVWAQQQRDYYVRQSVDAGTCPPPAAIRKAEPAPQDPAPAENDNQSCKHLELENQNIPNPGGSMGYALLWTCKD